MVRDAYTAIEDARNCNSTCVEEILCSLVTTEYRYRVQCDKIIDIYRNNVMK